MPGTVLEALAQTDAEITLLRRQVTIKCPNRETRQTIDELLRQHGLQPEGSSVETESLEHIFFSAIQVPPKL